VVVILVPVVAVALVVAAAFIFKRNLIGAKSETPG
jgi:hypothetical protein